jgi:hypothetical protein
MEEIKMGLENILYPRPTEEFISVNRNLVDGTCPKCGGKDIKRYPIASYLGPKMTTKCQNCFYHLSIDEPKVEDRWPPFRSLAFDWQSSEEG